MCEKRESEERERERERERGLSVFIDMTEVTCVFSYSPLLQIQLFKV